jgi:hypothetical protein
VKREDYECWDGYGDDRDFSPATRLDWGWMNSIREPCEDDAKGRREHFKLVEESF